MKLKKILLPVIVFLMLTLISISESHSATITIGVSNFVFTPDVVNANVGDSIKWVITSGFHTTTCNGSSGTTRPAGAAPWDSEISSGTPSFIYVITVPGMYNYICTPHAPSMAGQINAVQSSIIQLTEQVSAYELSQNYPNPFNPATKINFSIPSTSQVALKVYNNAGEEVETLLNQKLGAGSYSVDWNAVNFTSGVYYYRIITGDFIHTRKMFLIK